MINEGNRIERQSFVFVHDSDHEQFQVHSLMVDYCSNYTFETTKASIYIFIYIIHRISYVIDIQFY